MTDKEVVVPDLGGADNVDVIELCVKVGDKVKQEDSLIVVESDKATIEVPAPFDGDVSKLVIAEGDSVKQGDVILVLTTSEVGSSMAVAEEVPEVESTDSTPPVEVAPEIEMPAVKSIKEILVPDIGGSEEVEIIEINVAVGDELALEDTMLVLESDKATMEVPCSEAGVVKEILVSVGGKVSEGSPILKLETSTQSESTASQKEDAATQHTAPAAEPDSIPKKAPVPVATEEKKTSKAVHAGPAVRRLARELGVDLSEVKPTGPKNRILKDDVHAHVKQIISEKARPATPDASGLPPLPAIDFTKFGPVEAKPLSRINKVSAANLHRSWVNVPHVTQFDEADVTELEAFRKAETAQYKEQGIKLTLLAFMVKACAKALKAFPRFNSSLSQDGESLVFKQYCHIGIAVDTPNGLVVPVIRDADQKNVIEIAEAMQVLSVKARDKKLSPNDMQGGCFSISSLGGIGGTAFTPIVNWPEVAILGLSRSQMKPVYQQGEFVPRLMLPMSLSYDHRVIDGADAARFTRYLSEQVSDIRRMLL